MLIQADLRRLVRTRANFRCEYCFLPEGTHIQQHHVDHIRPQKLGGLTEANNLALACPACNWAKGTNVGSFDSETDKFEFFFNPRTQSWLNHFQLDGVEIIPLTATARVTAHIFQFNTAVRTSEREVLIRTSTYSIPTKQS